MCDENTLLRLIARICLLHLNFFFLKKTVGCHNWTLLFTLAGYFAMRNYLAIIQIDVVLVEDGYGGIYTFEYGPMLKQKKNSMTSVPRCAGYMGQCVRLDQ